MTRTIIATMFTAAIIIAAPAFSADLCTEPVRTATGKVKGISEADACVWKGIPYARPPVGDLRWTAPQAAEPWDNVMDASSWGDRCVQKGGLLAGSGAEGAGMSEDCLNLNIWKPQKSGQFPVMVWIHGGGYYTGAGSDPTYWGDGLATTGDVIVVTINYRLTILGFMAHPKLREASPHDSTGGYGSMDQAFALNWIKDNIENFGGDPDNITIFGQSAGGASVCSMIATPLAKNTFNRAIMQSGLCELSQDLDTAYDFARETMKIFGCGPDDVECMRGIPAEKLVEKAPGELMDGFLYMPCHDGHVLDASPLETIRSGDYNKVDFMGGTVQDEFGKMVKLQPKYYYTMPCKYEKRLEKSFDMDDDQASRYIELYPLDSYKGRPVEAIGRGFGAHATMQCPTHRGLVEITEDGKKTWFYRFDYHGMKYGKYMGSFHGAELPFVFGSFDQGMAAMQYKKVEMGPVLELSDQMMRYWTNFAKTGDPNGDGLPEWTQFDLDDQEVMVLDVGKVGMEDASVTEDRCEFWNEYTTDFVPMANQLITSIF